MAVVLTREAVTLALDEIMEEFGADHVVEACRYGDPETGEPICIVGQVLYRLDPETFEQVIHGGLNSDKFDHLADCGFIEVDPEDGGLVAELRQMQRDQDFQRSWGYARAGVSL